MNNKAQSGKGTKAQRRIENSVPLCLSALVPNKRGLTLIEIMVVVAILAVITSTLFSVFQSSLFSQRKGTNKAIVYSEARAALDMMSREIEKAFVDERNGAHYELYYGASSYHPVGDSIGDEFYFITPIMGEVADGVRLREIGYWLKTDNTLQRHYDASPELTNFVFSDGTNEALIGNVSDLQFQYWGWDAINSQYAFMDPPLLGLSGYVLPRAIKIILVMQYEPEKDDIRQDTFITIVNIPGSGQ